MDGRASPSQRHAGHQYRWADLLEYLQSTGWSDHEVFGIHMAVEEALVYAIQHGNQEDPSKSVQVRYKATARHLEKRRSRKQNAA